jgi:23S rRNA (cytidine1920-2'-O)/16S rRNA (cytidine1409-2'-O)-methyltransferase
VRRGLLPSRTAAQEAIASGRILVSGSVASKPARMVAPSEPIELTGLPRRYVSRGGEKLEAALDTFGLDMSGLRCLDVGASTGGFTDCLLQRGAAEVVAVDVGRGQLEWSIRQDERVTVIEQTDVRDVDPSAVGDVGLVVADVSFISLRTVLPHIAALAGGAPIVALVKPQFEVGRGRVGKGGIVRDPALHEEAVADVIVRARELGLECRATVPSPILGAEGNREFFVHLEEDA